MTWEDIIKESKDLLVVENSWRRIKATYKRILPWFVVPNLEDLEFILNNVKIQTLWLDYDLTRIWKIGHRRWDIENSIFHDLKTNWYFDHNYTHDSNALQVLWLIFAITYNVYQLFVYRNLRSDKYKRQPKKELASKMLIDLTHITISLREIIKEFTKTKGLELAP